MPVNSRAKGKRGELEFAKALTNAGYPARRGIQFRGGQDSPDVICDALDRWHFEVKLYGTCQLFAPATLAEWDAQARADAGYKRPVIAHRWARSGWWVRTLPGNGARPYWQPLTDWLADVEAGLA